MNCRNIFSVPVRLFGRSNFLQAKPTGRLYGYFRIVPSWWSSLTLSLPSSGPFPLPSSKNCLAAKKLNLPKAENVHVETDTQKLAKYVCGTNLLMEGEDVKLKPDSEYPDWLWKITAPPPLEELDKNSKTYWNRIRSMRQKQIKYLKSLSRTSKVHK